jgi:DNA-binding MarR family transcriptional regulator
MTAALNAPAVDETASLDLGGLPDLLGFHLRLAQVAFYRDFSASLAHLDLTQKQGAVLQLIGANPGVSQVDLAGVLGTDRATMMAVVDRLEGRGLLVRERSSADRRRQHLHLTPAGQTVLADSRELIAEHEARFKARFTGAEIDQLVAMLRTIHRQL